MKTLILSAGIIGSAIGYYLSSIFKSEVTLIDKDANALESYKNNLLHFSNNKVKFLNADVISDNYLEKNYKNFDFIISALPWEIHNIVCNRLKKYPIHIIGIARPSYNYYHQAIKNTNNPAINACIIQGCGLEPGLSEIVTQHLVNLFAKPKEVFIATGGIPEKKIPPMNYLLSFDSNKLPFQYRETLMIKNNKILSVPRFSGIEAFSIDNMNELETWHDGLTPWLAEYLINKGIITCSQKTIRWAGYAQSVNFLHDTGLLSDEAVLLKNNNFVKPIELTTKILANKMRCRGDVKDKIIQFIQVSDFENQYFQKIQLTLIDNMDNTTKLSAMARTTGFITAIIAQYIYFQLQLQPGEYVLTQLYSPNLFEYIQNNMRNNGFNFDIKYL